MSNAAALRSRSKGTRRIAGRIAWRTARRHPGRSALIVALVALPTIGLAGAGVVLQSSIPTQDEVISYTLGHTEAMISVVSPPDPTLEQSPFAPYATERAVDADFNPTGYDPDDPYLSPAEVLPAGTHILSILQSTATVRTDAGIAGVTLIEGDAGDPALEGRFHLERGHQPRAASEVALTASALDRLGVDVGETLRVTEPRAADLSVVGVIDDEQRDDADAAIFVTDGTLSGTPAASTPNDASFYVADAPLDWQHVRELNQHGMVAYSRAVVGNPPPAGKYSIDVSPAWTDQINPNYLSMIAMGGAFAVFQVCLLAGAAFLVGMRADQRALATVASIGGEPRFVARIVSAGGLVLGGAGGILGAGLGALGAWGYLAVVDDGNAVTFPGFHPGPIPLVGAWLVAVLSGWIAALAAARSARKIDIVAALRGSRRPRPARTRRAIAGAVVMIVGIAVLIGGGVTAVLGYWPVFRSDLTTFAIALLVVGAIALQLGLVLTTPALLRLLARGMSRVSEGARLAGRDTSRNHARTVPAIAAVMSTVFVAAFAMTFVSSGQASSDADYLYAAAPGTVYTQLHARDGENATFPSDEQVVDLSAFLASTLGTQDISIIDGVQDPHELTGDAAGREQVSPRAIVDDDCQQDDGKSRWANQSAECPTYVGQLGWGDTHLLIGDASDLERLLGHAPSEAAIRMLAAGGAVALYPHYVVGGELALDYWDDAQVAAGDFSPPTHRPPARTADVPAIYENPGYPLGAGVILARSAADRLKLEYGPVLALAAVDGPMSDKQQQAMWAGLEAISPGSWANYEGGPPRYADGFAWLLLAATALIALAAASVTIGLARADAKRDDEVLDAVGAPPRLRRSITFWQAIQIAGVGTLLGTLVGMLPVLALAGATWIGHATGVPESSGPLTAFAAPWLQLGLVAVGVPLLIAAGSWATATRRRVAVRRVA